MVLYRPFIHHIVRTQLGDVPEMRSFACASACIKAGMQIVWIVEELDNRGLLVGAYWFTVYITFFAVMTLCMFILGNPHDPTIEEAKRAAEKGRRILSRLAVESVSAEKCLASLEVNVSLPTPYFQLLNTWRCLSFFSTSIIALQLASELQRIRHNCGQQ
jgi:hypothetical protein